MSPAVVDGPVAMDALAVDADQAERAALRRTLRLESEIDEARATGEQLLITGGGVPDLLIDPDRRALWLPDAIRSYCQRRGLGLVVYRYGEGAVSLPTLPDGSAIEMRGGADDSDPAEAFGGVLASVRQAGRPAIVLFDYLDTVLPVDAGAPPLEQSVLVEHMQALTADIDWQSLGLQLVVVDRGAGLNPRLTSQPGVRTVELSAPDLPELTLYLDLAVASTRAPLHLEPGMTVSTAGRRFTGLLLRDVRRLAALSSPAQPLTALQISGEKGRAISRQSRGGLDLLDDGVSFGQDVAGLHNVRLLVQDELRKMRLTVRVCLCGPPGTGKTHSARAIAGLLEVPLVSFGQILGELLGQAENNMRRVIALLKAMAPVALFMDEAEQGPLGSRFRSGQSGNEAYAALRAQLFEFLGDPGEDNGISVIITTNVPDQLDPAAQSRFTFLPVLFASAPELAQIMAIQARREGVLLDGDPTGVLAEYLTAERTLSGRSAAEVLSDAQILALRTGREAITPDDIGAALRDRLTTDFTAAAEFSTLCSLKRARKADVLPWRAAARLGEPYPIPSYLGPYLAPDGGLNTTAIDRALAQLGSAGGYA